MKTPLTVAGNRGRVTGAFEQIFEYRCDGTHAVQRTGHALVVRVKVFVGAVRRNRTSAQLAVGTFVTGRVRDEMYTAVRVLVVLRRGEQQNVQRDAV